MIGRTNVAFGGNDFQRNYALLDYIQSSGTQYIDTGVIPKTTTKVSIGFQPTSDIEAGKYRCIVGASEGSPKRYAIAFCRPSSNLRQVYINLGDQTVMYTVDSLTEYYDTTLDAKNNKFIVNGDVMDIVNPSFTNYDLPLLIFSKSLVSGIEESSSCKLMYCKIWEDDVMVRNFVPCYRKSDYVAGLYDLVEGKFYTNAGTGDFITEPKEHAVYLYNNGDECTALTGGFSLSHSDAVTLESNHIQVIRTQTVRQGVVTVSPIDLSPYKKLCINADVKLCGVANGLSLAIMETSTIAGTQIAYVNYATGKTEDTSTDIDVQDAVYTLDISEITSSSYVAVNLIAVSGLDTHESDVKIYKIWLE